MTTIPVPQCLECIHFNGEKWNCDAFQGGIPESILYGEFDHTEPYPGDHGIQFERIDKDETQ